MTCSQCGNLIAWFAEDVDVGPKNPAHNLTGICCSCRHGGTGVISLTEAERRALQRLYLREADELRERGSLAGRKVA